MKYALWHGRLLSSVLCVVLLAGFATATDAHAKNRAGQQYAYGQGAPFARGEGQLISSQLMMTFSTATNGAAVPGLDSFYGSLICAGLSSQNCAANVSNLNTTQFGNFNLANDPIGDNPLGIGSVHAVKIDYQAINVDGSRVLVSGGIDIPAIRPRLWKGIILYFHGTTTEKINVPSSFTPTSNLSTYTDGTLLASVWASQGYIVVMPDYIGLGDDPTHIHPYVVFPEVDAQSGLAMLKAVRSYLRTGYRLNRKLPLFITGYSEGGAYALEAAHLIQLNPRYGAVLKVQLREAAPMSGFFDLSGTGVSYLFDNVTDAHNQWFSLSPVVSALSKPYLSAYLVLSFANYSGISPTAMLASDFYNCPGNSGQCGASNNLDGLYFTAPQMPGYDAVVSTLAYALATTTGWSTADNPVTPLLTETYADGLMNRDPSNPLYQQLVSADTYSFTPNFRVALVSLMKDSVVTRVNSDVAYSYFTGENPGGPYQEILVDNSNFVAQGLFSPGPIDHTSELPFLAVLVLNQFNLASGNGVRLRSH